MNIREFFSFNKSDRAVLLVLLGAVVLFLGAAWLLGDGGGDDAGEAGRPTAQRSAGRGGKTGGEPKYYRVEGRRAELFAFDPNTADSTELLRLGLQPWQVRNIYRYRAAGGIYRKPQDFARLYGLTVKQYRALEPYIRISADYQDASTLFANERQGGRRYEREAGATDDGRGQMADGNGGITAAAREGYVRDTLRYPIKLRPGEQISLNEADTTMLRKVPGIGSYYARRIVGYRERLGGYYDAGQLMEIEGFPEDALPYFKVSTAGIARLNVNRLSAAQLRKHPYISYFQAKAIADYRRLNGPLKSLQELRLLNDFTPQAIERIEPYVEF